MMAGEGIFYCAWVLSWAQTAVALHEQVRASPMAAAANVAAPLVLLCGPGQIVAICALPVALLGTEPGMVRALSLYCEGRTGVTYKILYGRAVLAPAHSCRIR